MRSRDVSLPLASLLSQKSLYPKLRFPYGQFHWIQPSYSRYPVELSISGNAEIRPTSPHYRSVNEVSGACLEAIFRHLGGLTHIFRVGRFNPAL